MYSWEFLTYFFRYQEISHPENFHQSNSLLVNSALENSHQKTPTCNIPTHVFKYSRPSFLIFLFFSLLSPLSLVLLKRRFLILCYKSAEVFTFLNICQNEVLSEERQLMKWVGIFQVIIFWVAMFRGGGDFPGVSLMGRKFSGGNSSGGTFHRTIFFI